MLEKLWLSSTMEPFLRNALLAFTLDTMALNLRRMYIQWRHASHLKRQRRLLLLPEQTKAMEDKFLWDGFKQVSYCVLCCASKHTD